MGYMADTVAKVLANASKAEIKHLEANDFDLAVWLVEKTIKGLTPTQAESVAFRVIEGVK